MASPTSRETFVSLLQAAGLARRFDFARGAATDWLAAWPGDSEVSLQLARSELDLGLVDPAVERLNHILAADPESVEAYALLARAHRQSGDELRSPMFDACHQALRGLDPDPVGSPPWALPLARAVRALSDGDLSEAHRACREALTFDPSLPLPAMVMLRVHIALGDFGSASALATSTLNRWPECLGIQMIQSIASLRAGQQAEGVASLHRLAAADPVGIVAESLMGTAHPYRALWPVRMEVELSRPIPAAVAAVWGGTSLAEPPQPPNGPPAAPAKHAVARGHRKMPTPVPGEQFRGPDPGDRPVPAPGAETLIAIRTEFDRLAQRLNARKSADGREPAIPAYIVVSSHTRMVQEFGEAGFARVDGAIRQLVEAVGRQPGWAAYRFYVDDPKLLAPFGLRPCDPGNAWQVKLRLTDLDQALRNRGERVAAVLIVGGHALVPFHMLPNPTDDDDELVPSDNPYATSDENYFAPEWPVGRLPTDSEVDLLVSALQSATRAHREAARTLAGVGSWIRDRFGRFVRPDPTAVGYSASIWRKASLAVFRPIGPPRSMITSPPAQSGAIPSTIERPNRLSYFNLHGLEDAPEWFGQRDPLRDQGAGSDFPVALRPQDVVNGGRAPKVVFTEACYGANVLGKSSESALSLKFLASGTHAVVGSTKISYGAIAPPLIAADLIGQIFWDELRRGTVVGEALRRAKLRLVAEMTERQGYLDGEDQKTLISFVLYGDPLYSPSHPRQIPTSKGGPHPIARPRTLTTGCALGGPDLLSVDPDRLESNGLRAMVAKYLPNMVDADCRLRTQHWGCSDPNHCCPTQQIGVKSVGTHEVYVLTLGKRMAGGNQLHPKFARLTMDKSGKLLKLAVSR